MSRRYYRLIGPVARIRGKEVLVTEHFVRRSRERSISLKTVLETISRPYKVLRDTKPAKMKGYTRLVYASKKHCIIVITEENSNIIIVTTWKTTKNIDKLIKSHVRRGVWIEG